MVSVLKNSCVLRLGQTEMVRQSSNLQVLEVRQCIPDHRCASFASSEHVW